VFVLLNRFPYAAGHLMVAPYTHAGRLHDLDADARTELIARLAQCTAILEATYACEGLNVGANLGKAAGAGFADHLHFHVVPRWSGDVNFMTSIGEIRVIPTHIQHTYDRLLPAFAELDAR
jgi:ATP adenylyltransferase